MTKKDEKRNTIEQTLLKFVLDRWEFSRRDMQSRQDQWRKFYDNYRGKRDARKEWWQANYIIPALKEALRIKIPLYMNILFSNGFKSFDIEPGSIEDEPKMPAWKSLLIYGLRNIARKRGGLFQQWEDFIKQREMYGYTLAKIIWREEHNHKGELIFSGPDMETLDNFSFYPDPGAIGINESWKIILKRDVFASHLRDLENQGIYENIKKLYNTSQPDASDIYGTTTEQSKDSDRVELLEYHGEVPKSLLEGKYTDMSKVNPYEDDYVYAIITVANREVVIRRDEYPYNCRDIFIEASKDKLPNEHFGVGTAEDIEAMAQELTNVHNKLTDCINLISNPMGVCNPQNMQGVGGTIITYPGKIFTTAPGVENVTHALYFLDTRAQASSLTPLIRLIAMLKEEIQKNTQAVPVISPVVTSEGLPDTLGATQMIQANASEPLKHDIKHSFETAFQSMLEIMYEHYNQFLKEESAYRILGKEKAERWIAENKRDTINKKDLKLQANPDFIPRGVSVFAEKQIERRALIEFLQTALNAIVPALDDMGNPMIDADGKPIMIPKADVGEIIRRIAEMSNFEDIERLLPYLKEERIRREVQEEQKAKGKQKGKEIKPPPPGGVPTAPVPSGAGSISPASQPTGIRNNIMPGGAR